MAETSTPGEREAARAQAEAFAHADLAYAFGPSFFLGHLGRFVRDHCPEPGEHLPGVQIRLADGTTFDLCHIIGVSPRWVILAVRDPGSHHESMTIELVPFEMIRGVSIRPRHADGATVGFSQMRVPDVIGAETLLQAAMAGDAAGR